MFTLVSSSKSAKDSPKLKAYWSVVDHPVTEPCRDLLDMHAQHIVNLDSHYGFIGGARLFNLNKVKNVMAFSPLLDIIKKFGLMETGKKIWMIDRVFFHLDDASPYHEDGELFVLSCRRFYQEFYEYLLTLGEKLGTQSFIVFNPIDEHEDTKFFGYWPYTTQCQATNTEEESLIASQLPVNEEGWKNHLKFKAQAEGSFGLPELVFNNELLGDNPMKYFSSDTKTFCPHEAMVN